MREAMELNEYQLEAIRTAPCGPYLTTFALGIAGEAGEVADLVKKHVGHGHPLDREKLAKELGDVLWYVAGLATEIGVSLESVARGNLEKLAKRYPNGFSPEASMARVDVEPTLSDAFKVGGV
jgi:NTP pyrophosphatase (non-canonical NTP hydrolase)